MPYIICVNMPGCLPEADPIAVATLGEAREAAAEELDASLPQDRAMNSDEQRTDRWARLAIRDNLAAGWGGTVKRPDGYVIDVRHVTDAELAAFAQLGYDDALHFTRDQIINAYNEA